MSEEDKMDDNTDQLPPVRGRHHKPSHRTWVVLVLIIIAVTGLLIAAVSYFGGSDKAPVAHASAMPTTSSSPSPSPKATGSKTPEPTVTKTGSKASKTPEPTATKTGKIQQHPTTSKSPTAAPKCKVPVIQPAVTSGTYAGKEAVKAIIKQNQQWSAVYGGKFYFPYENPNMENMSEFLARVDRDGPQRAGFDLAGLYWNHSNRSLIQSRLKAVSSGPCAKLAKVDLAYGEYVQSLYDDWNAAAGDKAAQTLVMDRLNAAAKRFLYLRNQYA